MCEPRYDDMSMEIEEDLENRDLLCQLWQYILALEEYIIRLRNQTNQLTSKGKEPYPNPASDFSMRFYDHPQYKKYRDILENEEGSWKIPD